MICGNRHENIDPEISVRDRRMLRPREANEFLRSFQRTANTWDALFLHNRIADTQVIKKELIHYAYGHFCLCPAGRILLARKPRQVVDAAQQHV